MKPQRITAGLGVASLLAFAFLGVSSPAMADDGPQFVAETYTDDAGVYHYAYDPAERPGADVDDEQGVASADGTCSFAGEGTGDSATVTVVDEVTFDPATCTRELSIAIYDADAVPAAVQEDLGTQEGVEYAQAQESSSGDDVAPQASWTQKLSAWVGDPVGIHVTETNITRTWQSTGAWHNDYHWGWYSPTGWSRTAHSTVGTATVGDTIGSFKNTAFCNPFAATYSEHYKTRLTTSTSGSWNWSYSMNKSGDCSSLLSYHYALG